MSGQVDISRVIRQKSDPTFETIYRRYEEGAEGDATTEAVICLDLSGSMKDNRLIGPASEALWSMKHAFDQNDVMTTVLGFAYDGYVLYRKSERLDGATMRNFAAGGGTNPETTLQMAHHILTHSPATNKLLVMITDGDWSGVAAADELIASMKKFGVFTMLFCLDVQRIQAVSTRWADHGCQVAKIIHDPMDMIVLVKQVVAGIMMKHVRSQV
jgi:Mg-chelatase subunit ChlD